MPASSDAVTLHGLVKTFSPAVMSCAVTPSLTATEKMAAAIRLENPSSTLSSLSARLAQPLKSNSPARASCPAWARSATLWASVGAIYFRPDVAPRHR
jgi:hypothetical protein